MVPLWAELEFDWAGVPTWVYLVAGGGAAFLVLVVVRALVGGKQSVTHQGPMAYTPVLTPAEREAKQQHERRRHPRRKGNPLVVLVSPYASGMNSEEATILDRSAGGLCLLCVKEYKTNAVLFVRPARVPDKTPWVGIQVRHCRASGEGYYIGCQFTEAVPTSLLLLFG